MKILILNLMPNKVKTENQFKKALSFDKEKIKISFLMMSSYEPKNISKSYLDKNYMKLSDINLQEFDGFICTGAPVEKIEFEQVLYWKELTKIFDLVNSNKIPSYYICWGAQAVLYHFYRVNKFMLKQKLSGIFPLKRTATRNIILKGLDKIIRIPVSRYTGNNRSDIANFKHLKILLESKETGPGLIYDENKNSYLNFNHFEYDTDSLFIEYHRDLKQKLNPKIPLNYFQDDNVKLKPLNSWSINSKKFFLNWLAKLRMKKNNH